MWKTLTDEAISLYQKGQYDRAVVVAKKALEVAEKAVGPEHPDVDTGLKNIAELYRNTGREDATYEHWHWVPVYAGTDRQNGIELDAGTRVFRFQNREDGIRLDQIFITPWHKDEFQRRVPQGIE